jgi:hypothetical protein
MTLLIFLCAALVLFFGFVFLTAWETRSGVRIFGTLRTGFDTKLQAFIDLREKVSLRIVIVHFVQSLTRRFMHDVLRVALAALAVIERALLRAGSYMHSRALSAPSLHAKTHVSEALTHLKRTLAPSKDEDEKSTKVE